MTRLGASAASSVLPVSAVIAMLALPVLPGGRDGATAADAVSGLLVLWCGIRLLRQRRRPLSRTAAAVLGLPVVGLALAAAGAASPGAGISGFARYLQIFVLVPAAVLLSIRGRADFRVVAWAFVGLALWQGAVGVHQYATGTGASYAGEDIRAVGTFGPADVMGMATVVSLGLVCAVGLALGRHAARQRAAAVLCAVVLAVPLAVSFSRGAWIATAVACALQVVLTGLRRAVTVFAAVAAAGVVLVGGLGIGSAMFQQRIGSITEVTDAPDQSVTDRYTMWAAAVDMWHEQPLTGVGLKGFPAYRDGHASLALSSGSDIAGAGTVFHKQPLLSPHNMYLLVLSEQGLVGLLTLAGSWLALLVCAVRGLVRVRREPGGPVRGTGGPVRGTGGPVPGPGGLAPGPGGPVPGSSGLAPASGGLVPGPGGPARGPGGPVPGPGGPARGPGGPVPGPGGPASGPRGLDCGPGGPVPGPGGPASGPRGLDCGLVACGVLVWVLVDFVYADIGGPSTVLTAVAFGLVAWWALADTTSSPRASAGARAGTAVPEGIGAR